MDLIILIGLAVPVLPEALHDELKKLYLSMEKWTRVFVTDREVFQASCHKISQHCKYDALNAEFLETCVNYDSYKFQSESIILGGSCMQA